MKSYINRNNMLTKQSQKELADFRAFLRVKDGVAQQIIAAALYAYHLQGYRKKRINDMFEEILSVLNMPPVMGGQFTGNNLIDFIHKEYDIDFERVKLQAETEQDYIKRTRKDK